MLTGLRLGLIWLLGALLTAPSSFAEDRQTRSEQTKTVPEQASPQKQQRADDLALLTKVAAGYTLKLDKGPTAELNREPAFRWSNSVAGTIGREVKDAALFFWMADERPVAIGTIVWYSEIGLYHEFQSLAFESLTAERNGEKVWEPAQPGIAFAPLPNAPEPAASEANRLIQMKSLAGRFRAEVIKGLPSFPEGSVWQLRLLPKPLLRYGSPKHLARDGAVFAFCQDSDPDVFLMLEVRGHDSDLTWHYAMGPLTSREAKGWYDDQPVWSIPLRRPPSDPKRPYFVAGPFPTP
jgi:hypothetical protein